MQFSRSKLKEKLNETLKAVFPILAIVLLLCFTIAPISPSILMTFLIGAVLLIIGMLLFSFGVDLSMTQMGERVGTTMTKSRNVLLMTFISFIMGLIITISEPDLQVLARQVPSIPNMVIILAVAGGVGVFLVIALLRMLFSIALSHLLIIFYLLVFLLTLFVPADFLAVAFDSGGVASDPMTATFLLPFAMGACQVAGGNIITDAFGVVAMVAMTHLITIQIMGLVFRMKENRLHKSALGRQFVTLDAYGDMEIIEL